MGWVWKLQFVFWYYSSSLDTFNAGELDRNKGEIHCFLLCSRVREVITSQDSVWLDFIDFYEHENGDLELRTATMANPAIVSHLEQDFKYIIWNNAELIIL